MTDLEIVRNYLDWQYAIKGGLSTEGCHKALVREERPMPTLAEARAALARIEQREEWSA